MTEPKVRFKREDGSNYPEWQIIPFSQLSVPSGVKNKNNADLESYSISNEKGFVPQNEQFEDAGYLNNADRSMYYIVSPGSFAYNPARINIGSIGYQNVGKDVLVSSLYEVFNTSDELDDSFLMNWFRTEQFQKNVRTLSEGGVRQYFYYDKLCMVKFPLPCIEEQLKIADFLSSVDEVIAISEQEVANLETQKKAVMKKIFSQEVRFKREDGSGFPEWGKNSLSNLCGYVDYRGKTPEKVDSGVFLVTAKNIRMGYIDYDVSQEFISDDDYDDVMHRGKPAIGDVLFTTEAPCGMVAQVDRDNIALAQRVIKYRAKDVQILLNDYLKYALMSHVFQKELEKKATGGTVKGIKGEVLHEMTVIYPCPEEQRLIADFLSDYDEAIAAAKKELELWKELKKGLQQQLFV